MSIYPDFLIIGAARSGTSSLHKNLEAHPQIVGPKLLRGNHKEAHFFDKSVKYGWGLKWYLSLWNSVDGSLKFESTPNYLFVKEVPRRIKESLINYKELKFIVMLRDPVLRAWSHFWHWREKHRKPQQVLMNPDNEFVKKGEYIEQLYNWQYYFKKEQFLIIKSEDFFANPRGVILEVHKWLGIEPISINKPRYFDPKKLDQYKKSKYFPIPTEIRDWLSRYYKPYNKELFKYLGKEFEDWL